MILKIVVLVALVLLLRYVVRQRINRWMTNRYQLYSQVGLTDRLIPHIHLRHDNQWSVNVVYHNEEYHEFKNFLDAFDFVQRIIFKKRTFNLLTLKFM